MWLRMTIEASITLSSSTLDFGLQISFGGICVETLVRNVSCRIWILGMFCHMFVDLDMEWCLYFEHIVRSFNKILYLLCMSLGNTPCHMPLKY